MYALLIIQEIRTCTQMRTAFPGNRAESMQACIETMPTPLNKPFNKSLCQFGPTKEKVLKLNCFVIWRDNTGGMPAKHLEPTYESEPLPRAQSSQDGPKSSIHQSAVQQINLDHNNLGKVNWYPFWCNSVYIRGTNVLLRLQENYGKLQQSPSCSPLSSLGPPTFLFLL